MSNDQWCQECGCPYPATSDNFYLKTSNANGLDTVCKECRRKEDRERYKERKKKLKAAAEKKKESSRVKAELDISEPEAPETPKPDDEFLEPSTSLMIDLADYPNILNPLIKIAKERYRTPRLQALQFLDAAVRRAQAA